MMGEGHTESGVLRGCETTLLEIGDELIPWDMGVWSICFIGFRIGKG
jgi:hypothetical protein